MLFVCDASFTFVTDPLAVQKVTKQSDAVGYTPQLGSNMMVLDYDEAGLTTRGKVGQSPAHEMGHQLGVGHNSDESSLMGEYKQPGQKLQFKDAKRMIQGQFNLPYKDALKEIENEQKNTTKDPGVTAK